MSLSVGGFEDGLAGIRGIGAFLVKGEEAKAMKSPMRSDDDQPLVEHEAQPEKRRKTDQGGIERFFPTTEEGRDDHDDPDRDIPREDGASLFVDDAQSYVDGGPSHGRSEPSDTAAHPVGATPVPAITTPGLWDRFTDHDQQDNGVSHHGQSSVTDYFCDRCGRSIGKTEAEEHQDWHFAVDLEKEETRSVPVRPTQDLSSDKNTATKTQSSSAPFRGKEGTPSRKLGSVSRGGAGRGKVEKGQSRLAFGR